MIWPSYVRTLARYNSWQNTNIYGAAGALSDAQRKEDRGAFFGSIHATLNHILWADQVWLHRLGAAAPPAKPSIAAGLSLHESWEALSEERRSFDALIENWANHLQPSDLEGDLTWYSGATGRELTHPRAFLAVHLFNHQTHHRGQVHALLTGFGIKPGVMDLPFGEDIYMG